MKILLQRENSACAPNSQPRIPTRGCQGSVVTADLPTLGATPNDPEVKEKLKGERLSSSALDQADCPQAPGGPSARPGRTVYRDRADRLRGLGGLSAKLRRTVRKQPPNLQYCTLNNGPSVMGPRTVRPDTDCPAL
jgi:hypothetical protein